MSTLPLSIAVLLTSFLQPAELDLAALATETRAQAGSPALALVVLHRGEQPVVVVDGLRLAGSEAEVTPQDLWHLGSITKSFTATLVARLVEQEVVSWDDTLHSLLGEAVPDMQADYRDVTFLHLLSHRAGLHANIPMPRFGEFGQTPEDPIADRLTWVRIALAQKPRGPKQEHFEYSNNGFIVAGAMLEAATGKSWEELMQLEIFTPLGLESAGFGPPRGARGDEQPRGHKPFAGADRPVPPDADNPAALGPAGRVHMSMADIARYLSAHAEQRGGFLTRASFERLHTPPFGGNYALGWIQTGPKGGWHNGSNTMWYAEVAFDSETGTVAAVVVNDGDSANVRAPVTALLRKLMK